MSKTFFLNSPSLHTFPTFVWRIKSIILLGNGQYVCVLLVILVVTDLHRHSLEVYTLVSEIHDNVDMVMGMKIMYEIKGIISSRDFCIHFLNRSILFFPRMEIFLKPKEQRLMKTDVPLIYEISGLAVIKLHDYKSFTNMIKLKFVRNTGFLDVTSNSSESIIFDR